MPPRARSARSHCGCRGRRVTRHRHRGCRGRDSGRCRTVAPVDASGRRSTPMIRRTGPACRSRARSRRTRIRRNDLTDSDPTRPPEPVTIATAMCSPSRHQRGLHRALVVLDPREDVGEYALGTLRRPPARVDRGAAGSPRCRSERPRLARSSTRSARSGCR